MTPVRDEIQDLYFWLGEEAERAGFTPWVTGWLGKDRMEHGVDKLGVPFWPCPGCGKQWIKTQRNYCPKCRFGMGAE
jgi:hypothetical protein